MFKHQEIRQELLAARMLNRRKAATTGSIDKASWAGN